MTLCPPTSRTLLLLPSTCTVLAATGAGACSLYTAICQLSLCSALTADGLNSSCVTVTRSLSAFCLLHLLEPQQQPKVLPGRAMNVLLKSKSLTVQVVTRLAPHNSSEIGVTQSLAAGCGRIWVYPCDVSHVCTESCPEFLAYIIQ